MATYNKGILGDFSGKVGPVIGSSWRGKSVLRSLPNKSNKPPSAAQLLQRDKFKYVHTVLTPLKPLLSETFGVPIGSKSRYNQAISYHLKEAIIYNNPHFNIRYSKILISMGHLCPINNPMVAQDTPGQLTIHWQDNSQQGMAYPNDTLIVAAYAPGLKLFVCFTDCAYREDAGCIIDFEPVFHGLEVQLWLGFTNTQKQLSANSSYIGGFTI